MAARPFRFRPLGAPALALFAALAATLSAAPATARSMNPTGQLPRNLEAHYARFTLDLNEMPELRSRQIDACERRAGTNDRAGLACEQAEYAYVDRLLNSAWAQVMPRLSRAEQVQLRASQRRWLATRFSRCTGIERGATGLLAQAVITECRTNEARRRTQWLAFVAADN